MDKIIEILLYIDELYKDSENTESISLLKTENPEKYEMWRKAFEEYTIVDLKSAVRRYWTYKNDKTVPKVAHLLAYLEEDHKEDTVKTIVAETTAQAAKGDFAWERMNNDIATGDCKANLYMYRKAEDLIIDTWLLEVIPASEWAKMDRMQKLAQAEKKGLMNRFNEALRIVCLERFDREQEFLSANQMKEVKANKNNKIIPDACGNDAVNILAAHWKMGA